MVNWGTGAEAVNGRRDRMSYGQEVMLPGSKGCELQSYMSRNIGAGEPAVMQVQFKYCAFSLLTMYTTGCTRLGLVLFHPYALLGGCCDDPIVRSLFRSNLPAASPKPHIMLSHLSSHSTFRREAVQSAAFHTVVRYNQRGVGSSSGFKSIWGGQDMADAISLCHHVLNMPEGPTHLHVVG